MSPPSPVARHILQHIHYLLAWWTWSMSSNPCCTPLVFNALPAYLLHTFHHSCMLTGTKSLHLFCFLPVAHCTSVEHNFQQLFRDTVPALNRSLWGGQCHATHLGISGFMLGVTSLSQLLTTCFPSCSTWPALATMDHAAMTLLQLHLVLVSSDLPPYFACFACSACFAKLLATHTIVHSM